jgi:hypothetical protein
MDCHHDQFGEVFCPGDGTEIGTIPHTSMYNNPPLPLNHWLFYPYMPEKEAYTVSGSHTNIQNSKLVGSIFLFLPV